MNNPILRYMMLAQAAWMEMEASIKSMEAAVIRGDSDGANSARTRAHDHLDSHLDLKAAAQTEVLNAATKRQD